MFSLASVILFIPGEGESGQRGKGVCSKGGCLVWGEGESGQRPLPPEMVTAAVGTHPTGMLSYIYLLLFYMIYYVCGHCGNNGLFTK